MEKIKVEGIVVREVMYGESSKILTILTREFGLVGVMAKGARSVKSKLRGVSGRLTYGTFYLNYKNDGLSTLIAVDVISPFLKLISDIKKISYASYLLELSEQVVKESFDKDIFDLLVNALLKIDEGFDEEGLKQIIEVQYLKYLGVKLELSSCAICRDKTQIQTISVDAGGFLCINCRKDEKIYDKDVIQFIRMFQLVDISKIKKLEVEDKVKKEIDEFLELYYEKYTGLYFKSRAFLKNLKRIG